MCRLWLVTVSVSRRMLCYVCSNTFDVIANSAMLATLQFPIHGFGLAQTLHQLRHKAEVVEGGEAEVERFAALVQMAQVAD